jgi:hypothetical protein
MDMHCAGDMATGDSHTLGKLSHTSTHTNLTPHNCHSHKRTTTTDHLHGNQQALWFKIAVAQAQKCSTSLPSLQQFHLARQGRIKLLSWRDKGQQTALQQAAATAAAMLVRTQCVCRRHFKPQDENTPQATNRHTRECARICVKNLAAARKI